MDVRLYPSKLSGIAEIPPSKSITHRAMIAAAFSQGFSEIKNALICEDTIATASALKKLGADITYSENRIQIRGRSSYHPVQRIFDMKESASSLRMMLPIFSCFLDDFIMSGSKKLMERVYTEDLRALTGLTIRLENNQLRVSGLLSETDYYLSGLRTTQLVSGMILALPFMKPKTVIHLNDLDYTNPYLQMTFAACSYFGTEYIISSDNRSLTLKPNTSYHPQDAIIEGDFSNAAFWIAASYLHPGLSVSGINPESIQADRAILDDFSDMGVLLQIAPDCVCYQSGKIGDAVIDISKTPDIGPILASVASLGTGRVVLQGIERLAYKESNRIEAIIDGITRLGGNICTEDNKMIIDGKSSLLGGCTLESYNDHRIAMALAIVSSRAENPVILRDYRCIDKSYPNFFEEYQKLGGKVEVI
jgi:3-phosphoshikimate 1-carboxyvinyltransferase